MTGFSSGVNGFARGMELGAALDGHKENKRLREEELQLRREKMDMDRQSHGMQMKQSQGAIDLQQFQMGVQKDIQSMKVTEQNQKALAGLASAQYVLMSGAPQEIKDKFNREVLIPGMNAIHGSTMNTSGPGDIEQEFVDVEDSDDGLIWHIKNTGADGKSYNAPLTQGRKKVAEGGKTAVQPYEAVMAQMQVYDKWAKENGVDPQKIAQAWMAQQGTETFSDAENRGMAGQRSNVTGKFDPYSNQVPNSPGGMALLDKGKKEGDEKPSEGEKTYWDVYKSITGKAVGEADMFGNVSKVDNQQAYEKLMQAQHDTGVFGKVPPLDYAPGEEEKARITESLDAKIAAATEGWGNDLKQAKESLGMGSSKATSIDELKQEAVDAALEKHVTGVKARFGNTRGAASSGGGNNSQHIGVMKQATAAMKRLKDAGQLNQEKYQQIYQRMLDAGVPQESLDQYFQNPSAAGSP